MAQKTITCPHCHGVITIDESLVNDMPTRQKPSTHHNNTDSEERTIFEIRPTIREYIPRIIGTLIISVILYTVTALFTHQFPYFFSNFIPLLNAETVNLIMLILVLAIVIVTVIRIFISIHSTEYKLTNQRFFLKKGFIARYIEEVELFRVKDVKSEQSIFQRILGVGDILILSTDDSAPELFLLGVQRPIEIKEQIRTAYRQIKKSEGVTTTEFIHS